MRYLILVAAVAMVGCTTPQREVGAEWLGERVEDVALMGSYVVTKAGDMIGLDQPEDPAEQTKDRRWMQCVNHDCDRAVIDACQQYDAFITPSCRGRAGRPGVPQGSSVKAVTPRQPVAGPAPEDRGDPTIAVPPNAGGPRTKRDLYDSMYETCMDLPRKDHMHCQAHVSSGLMSLGVRMDEYINPETGEPLEDQ